jgi:succinate dehydrogenase / fumarate reductase cytochrome b subunit
MHNPSRPLSPHLTIWKWGPHMAVSILHRVTGSGLSTVGVVVFVWWLVAAATSKEAYASFTDMADDWYGVVIGVGLSWAFFTKTLAGIRHLALDIGAGYELSTNKFWSNMVIVGSVVLTALLWIYILGVR